MHFPFCVSKGGKDFINKMVRHVFFKQKVTPLYITCGVTYHQSRISGIPTQQAIYNQQPTHLMNSPRSKRYFNFFLWDEYGVEVSKGKKNK